MTETFQPKFGPQGLLPAVVQDADTAEVLMVAYMNRGAIEKTRQTGLCHFWSRSRQESWLKGKQSGHTLEVVEIRTDCDQDTLLVLARPKVAACHMGYRSCFYRRLDRGDDLEIIAERVFDPDEVYGSA